MPQALGFAIAGLIGVGISAATATIIGTVVLTAITVGAQYVAGKLMRAPLVPTVKPSTAQQEIRQAIAPRRKSYGTVKVSGAVWWFSRSTSQPWNLFYGWAINHGRISAFVSYYIDENAVNIDGSDTVTTAPYTGQPTFLHHHLGIVPEIAYSKILSQFGIIDARGDGIASILGVFDAYADPTSQTSVYPGGLPTVRAVIDASVCFDPREPLHDVIDDTTWEFSDNPVVVILNYLIDKEGFSVDYAERILPNLSEWIGAMNICDEDIALRLGGTGKLYRIAGTFEFIERPVDVLTRMLASCDGRVWQRRDGSLGIIVGRFVSPNVLIEDKDIIGYEIEHGQDRLSAVAGLRAQYMSPEHDYREHEAEPWPSGLYVLGLIEDKVQTLDYTWCPSHAQARRLMKREYVRQTAEWRGQINTNIAGLRAIDERFIRVRIDDLGGVDTSFEVQKFTFDPSTLQCAIDIISVNDSIDTWDAEAEEGDSDSIFTFLSSFNKSGTAVDPIGEAGGVAGQTALVFAASSVLASTPSGWTLVQSVGPTSGLAMGVYSRVLLGTETSATFLGATGKITVILLQAPNPTFSDLGATITTSPNNIVGHTKEEIPTPFGAFAFGASNGDESSAGAGWTKLTLNDQASFPHSEIVNNGAGFSIGIEYILFRTEENAFTTRADVDHDVVIGSTYGVISFIIQPES